MEHLTYNLTEEQIKDIILETIATYKINEVLSKPQLTFTEATTLYGQYRVKKWIKARLLKPQSQNGSGNKIYYSHKRIIELSIQFRHDIANLKLQ